MAQTVTTEKAESLTADLYQVRCFFFMGPQGDGVAGFGPWQDIDPIQVEAYKARVAEAPNEYEIRALFVPTQEPEEVQDTINWKQVAMAQNAKLSAMLDEFGGLEKLQSVLARARGLDPQPLGYIDRKDIKRMSNYKATIWPDTNEIEAIPVYLCADAS